MNKSVGNWNILEFSTLIWSYSNAKMTRIPKQIHTGLPFVPSCHLAQWFSNFNLHKKFYLMYLPSLFYDWFKGYFCGCSDLTPSDYYMFIYTYYMFIPLKCIFYICTKSTYIFLKIYLYIMYHTYIIYMYMYIYVRICTYISLKMFTYVHNANILYICIFLFLSFSLAHVTRKLDKLMHHLSNIAQINDLEPVYLKCGPQTAACVTPNCNLTNINWYPTIF